MTRPSRIEPAKSPALGHNRPSRFRIFARDSGLGGLLKMNSTESEVAWIIVTPNSTSSFLKESMIWLVSTGWLLPRVWLRLSNLPPVFCTKFYARPNAAAGARRDPQLGSKRPSRPHAPQRESWRRRSSAWPDPPQSQPRTLIAFLTPTGERRLAKDVDCSFAIRDRRNVEDHDAVVPGGIGEQTIGAVGRQEPCSVARARPASGVRRAGTWSGRRRVSRRRN